MRIVLPLLLLIIVTAVAAFRLRESQPGVSQALYGFAILFVVMFVAAFFNFI